VREREREIIISICNKTGGVGPESERSGVRSPAQQSWTRFESICNGLVLFPLPWVIIINLFNIYMIS
jgi:hypothetical protein